MRCLQESSRSIGCTYSPATSFPARFQEVLNVYRDATERPYGYLMFDLHPNSSDHERLKTNLLRSEGYTTVYQKRTD